MDAYNTEHVEFIKYTGKFPTLCKGKLMLRIDGEFVLFGDVESADYPSFWMTGGYYDVNSDYAETKVVQGDWEIDISQIPRKYRKYASEIDEVLNKNVEHGCCGGCCQI